MPICLRLFAHCMRAAADRTFWTAGRSRPIRMAMMAMTTSSSIRVNPRFRAMARLLYRTLRFMIVSAYDMVLSDGRRSGRPDRREREPWLGAGPGAAPRLHMLGRPGRVPAPMVGGGIVPEEHRGGDDGDGNRGHQDARPGHGHGAGADGPQPAARTH